MQQIAEKIQAKWVFSADTVITADGEGLLLYAPIHPSKWKSYIYTFNVVFRRSACFSQVILGNKYPPRADKMAADQKISPMSAGMKSRPPILFPYSCWKGSSMVTYPRERMGFAKKRPPERRHTTR